MLSAYCKILLLYSDRKGERGIKCYGKASCRKAYNYHETWTNELNTRIQKYIYVASMIGKGYNLI